jgi:hypothetical protein
MSASHLPGWPLAPAARAVSLAIVAVFFVTGLRAEPEEPPPRATYVDEDYDLRVDAPPPSWQRYDPALLSVPGEVVRVWSPDGITTISVFVQKPGYPLHPRTLLSQSVAAVEPLASRIAQQEVREVAGLQAMWLVIAGPGTGAALTGAGDVETWQHWVAIPRLEDVVVLLLNAPGEGFEGAQSVFNEMLASLEVGGSQTEIQRAPQPPAEPTTAENLDFEAGAAASGFPSGWGGGGDGYELTAEETVIHGGAASGRIQSVASSENGFGTLTQGISAERWRGKRVRLSGWLRTRDVETGWAGLWMRVDPAAGSALAFDNMVGRGPKGTADWRRYEVVLDVAEEAKAVYFGALLAGGGTLWVDDLVLEEVPDTVETTGG